MPVVCCSDISLDQLAELLSRYGLTIQLCKDHESIPGSWFGEPEAGLIGHTLYVRNDTPLHSALHESCHYICMPASRRASLHTNAGGDYAEENGVCYLSLLLADCIDGFSQQRMFSDMDEWGYTFRLGSSRAWFESDAEDAREWLLHHQLIDHHNRPTWTPRQ